VSKRAIAQRYRPELTFQEAAAVALFATAAGNKTLLEKMRSVLLREFLSWPQRTQEMFSVINPNGCAAFPGFEADSQPLVDAGIAQFEPVGPGKYIFLTPMGDVLGAMVKQFAMEQRARRMAEQDAQAS
jgi:hypothetical protein